ncbi:MAG: ribose-phosphate pyrophosphokinase [bacterium]
MPSQLKLFTGNANVSLAKEIGSRLNMQLGNIEVGRFPDAEIEIKIKENVRGCDAFIIQPTSFPANEHLMELLLIVDALKRASARRITAVIPYYGYARADRKAEPRVPISAKLVANLLTASGADRILTMDLHAGQIQGFFDIPVDHLYATPVFIDYFKKKKLTDLVVVSPDAGGVERARVFAKLLECDLAIVDKRRISPDSTAVMHIIGDVKKKNVLIIDDLIDTGGTLCKTCDALKEQGALRVFSACAHGVLAGNAIEKIKNSCLEEIAITNSIEVGNRKIKKLVVLSVAGLLSKAIRMIHEEKSVSKLFINVQ